LVQKGVGEGGHKREYFEKKDLDYWDE